MHKFTKFRQNRSFRCRDIAIFLNFQDGLRRHLGFCQLKILLFIGVERVEPHQHAKFRQNRSIGCEDINIFQFFKMAAVRHIGIVWGHRLIKYSI